MENWSNLARVATMRTYSRDQEKWSDIVDRVIRGNVRLTNVPEDEINELRYLMMNRIAMPAGRGLWFSGTQALDTIGGAALNNCWFVTGDKWEHLVLACDLLMLGGGVGMSVQHKYVSKLPKVRETSISHKNTKDAFYIVPDSREGWCELIRLVLKSYFVTGRKFTYSTCCIRGKGERINGFGGTASGPLPLIECIETISKILDARVGKHIRPIDMADLLTCIGRMVVAGNVRRSAIIIIGDPWDREYLTCKRWDLRPVPVYRQFANFSVACSDIEDLHPSFWRTYEAGEPFGFVNLENIQKYGRMGELKYDSAIGVNPCVTGDTKVMTADGRGAVRIDQMGDCPVYCQDNKGELAVRWARNPRVTGFKPVLKVTLDNGESMRVTYNHKFYLRDGRVLEAKDLLPGDSLRVLTRYTPEVCEGDSRSDRYVGLNYRRRAPYYEHQEVAKFTHQETNLEGKHVHHIDKNPLNNSVDNLTIESSRSHLSAHSSGLSNPNYSGYSDKELVDSGVELCKTLNRRFSYNEWCQLGLITKFTDFRSFDFKVFADTCAQVSGVVSGADPRTLRLYNDLVATGLNCRLLDGHVVVQKVCEECKSDFVVPASRRGVCHCSVKCSQAGTIKPDVRTKATASLKATTNARQAVVRDQQITVYRSLTNPSKKNWQQACKKDGVSPEISRVSSPFRTFKDLQEAACYDNHKVVSVVPDGEAEVWNVTVDEFHNLFYGGWDEGLTDGGRRKLTGVLNANCAEATLENGEPCNLLELFMARMTDREQFARAARLMYRYGKRVCKEQYHHEIINEVIHRNNRIGVGITGCLQSRLFNPIDLDYAYAAIQDENVSYSNELGMPLSIRTTVVKPSGTLSILGDCTPGIHPAFAEYYIRRVRFADNSPLIPVLRDAGHKIEPQKNIDGSLDYGTLVVDFPVHMPNTPTAEHMTTWQQLDIVKMAQRHWADQSVSVTVYYKKPEIEELKTWVSENLQYLKTLSFLCYDDHGFEQAPMEKISKEQYERIASKVKPINFDGADTGDLLEDCVGGACPVR